LNPQTEIEPEVSRQEESEEDIIGERLKINVNPPSQKEIMQCIKEIKMGKTPGPDNINMEILKASPELIAETLLPLFKQIREAEKVPNEWRDGTLIKILKKGDLTVCKNWRGIVLLSTVSKIFTRIILNRIQSPVVAKLRREQDGFRENRSCIEQINTLRIIIEQTMEYQSTLSLSFIDFERLIV
jgi:hypothetical protein